MRTMYYAATFFQADFYYGFFMQCSGDGAYS